MQRSDKTIVIFGDGLAGQMTATAMSQRLGAGYQIVLIKDAQAADSDSLYGSVTSPTGYEFYRGLGLDEPTLFLNTRTTFSFGTYYRQWLTATGDWVQSHHQPLPLIAGVPLHHHLTRHGRDLAPLLISSQAAVQGKFAHPPEDPAVPLSRAEYGYQFVVEEWCAILAAGLRQSRVQICSDRVARIQVSDGAIEYLELSNGDQIQADLFIDASGPARRLVSALGGAFHIARSVTTRLSRRAMEQLGPACRLVTGSEAGYTSQTHVQGGAILLSVADADKVSEAEGEPISDLGRLDQAWVGNCVALGHAASVLDPVTPAPMMLLQRDIERLLELVPIGPNQNAERREFNRRFADDVAHAGMFYGALYQTEKDLKPGYWRRAKQANTTPKLARKIAQFENRGVLVRFDLEPFNDEDWLIQYYGMGRRPERYDLQVERSSKAEIDSELDRLMQSVDQMATRLPPHHQYVSNLKRYLEKQNHV